MHSVLCQNQDGQDYRRILVENSPLWHYRQYFLTLHENRIGGSAYTSSKLNIKKQCLVKYTIKKRGVQISFNVYLFLRLVEINSFSDQFPDFFYCLTRSDASGKIRHINTTTVFIFFKDDYIFHVLLAGFPYLASSLTAPVTITHTHLKNTSPVGAICL